MHLILIVEPSVIDEKNIRDELHVLPHIHRMLHRSEVPELDCIVDAQVRNMRRAPTKVHTVADFSVVIGRSSVVVLVPLKLATLGVWRNELHKAKINHTHSSCSAT